MSHYRCTAAAFLFYFFVLPLPGLLSLKGGQDDIMSYNGRFGMDLYAADENNGGNCTFLRLVAAWLPAPFDSCVFW